MKHNDQKQGIPEPGRLEMGELAEEDYYDDEDHEYTECWKCGGSGDDETMCECETVVDICFCLNPKPVACDICDGAGYWPVTLKE